MPNWHTERINRLIIQVIHEKKIAWQDFFELGSKDLRQELFEVQTQSRRQDFSLNSSRRFGGELVACYTYESIMRVL